MNRSTQTVHVLIEVKMLIHWFLFDYYNNNNNNNNNNINIIIVLYCIGKQSILLSKSIVSYSYNLHLKCGYLNNKL